MDDQQLQGEKVAARRIRTISTEIASELVTSGSIELIETNTSGLVNGQDLLLRKMGVYVPSLAKRSFETNLPLLCAVRDAGLTPIPHLAARRIKSTASLESFISRAVEEAGVNRVLLGGWRY
ncbi:MAG: hypothetical protein OXC05_13085 [Halieaceae bacterium]|nr:hypothetical protein [Halieaceae bacterium]